MWTLRLVMVWLLLVGSAVYGDVYKCPDGKGGTTFRDAPCVGATTPVFETIPRSAPSEPASAPPQATRDTPPPPLQPASPAPLPAVPLPTETPKSPSQPVDTLQFAHIKAGMSEDTVRERLGEPEKISKLPTLFRRYGYGGPLVEIQRTAWIYPGTRQVMEATIFFENGYVLDKKKEPVFGVR